MSTKQQETSRDSEAEEAEEKTPQQVFVIDAGCDTGPKTRAVSLIGTLDEEQLSQVLQSLVSLKETCSEERPKDPSAPEEGETEIIKKPINFYISTWGGDILGMFAIYDLMRMVREECDIHTLALGKVMSAGVLLLAAGTKGQRKIGKNTRVMIHGVQAGYFGKLPSLENEMEEIKLLQEQMIEELLSETKITKRAMNRMLAKKTDIYLSAQEAVDLGIADIIV
jgi:ATP-dependent Clp protease protease subunit|tara:strand:+ start:15689 stop:16360 length:672 start_codon:yes stop_codon:yes gene_type:complete